MICVPYVSVTLSVGDGVSEDCDKMATILTTTYAQTTFLYIYILC